MLRDQDDPPVAVVYGDDMQCGATKQDCRYPAFHIGIVYRGVDMSEFNQSDILMLFRCTKRKYAKAFQRGEIRLSVPSSWIEYDDSDGNGIGDKLEGVCLSGIEGETFDVINSLPDGVQRILENGLTFYRRKSILNLRCLCTYGLKSNQFEKRIDEMGKAHYSFSVPKSYFTGFSDCKGIADYSKLDFGEQPVVIMINDPNEFYRRISEFLATLKVERKSIIIGPVRYIDKSRPMVVATTMPLELLVKDKSYESQSEIRLIVNSQSEKYLEYLNNHNNTLSIGDISDITEILPYYFGDMQLERCGTRRVMFSLPSPKNYQINDLNYFELEDLIFNILGESVVLTGVPDNASTWQDKLKPIIDLVESKYGVHIFVDEGKRVHMYNLSKELLEQTKVVREESINRNKLEKEAERLLGLNQIGKTIELCERYYNDKKLCGVAFYFTGKAFLKSSQLVQAEDAFYKSYLCDYKRIESLDAIASMHFGNKDYEGAIKIYEVIQDEKGYDCKIWGNMAVCYSNMGEHEKAIGVLNKAIEWDPTIDWCHYNKACECYEIGKLEEAKDSVSKAVELYPDNSLYNHLLNTINKDMAKEDLR